MRLQAEEKMGITDLQPQSESSQSFEISFNDTKRRLSQNVMAFFSGYIYFLYLRFLYDYTNTQTDQTFPYRFLTVLYSPDDDKDKTVSTTATVVKIQS